MAPGLLLSGKYINVLKMALLNYTTKIPVETTIAEIEKMLADSGAEKIMKEYNDKGDIDSISFAMTLEKGPASFKLPMKIEEVMQTINNQTGEYRRQPSGKRVRVVPESMYNDYDQARRVGWRIIKDWLEAQLAIFFLRMVKIEEIFLPYMFNAKTGKTMFESLEESNFKFQLENKS